MKARIENAMTRRPGFGPLRKGSISLAVRAGRACIVSSGLEKDRVGLLINTGIYRDEHLGEPAIASLVQQGIGLNPRYKGKSYTFSFDLYNGVGGPLNAMEILSSQIGKNVIEYGLVTASDRNAYERFSKGYDLSSIGGAILMGPSKDGEGFKRFRTYTYPEYLDSFRSGLRFMKWNGRMNGECERHILLIQRDEEYMAKCIECGKRSFERFFQNNHMKPDEIDLVISSSYPPGLIKGLKELAILPEGSIQDINEELESAYTASIPSGIEETMKNGKFNSARNILFLGIGAGITVQVAHYSKIRNN